MDLIKLNVSYDASVKELNDILPGTTKKVQALTEKKLKQVTVVALQACQSKVPRFTDQLRDTQIKSQFSGSTARVYVTDAVHTATQGRNKPTASELARTLDIGIENGIVLHRRKGAISENSLFSAPRQRSLTADWISKAQTAFGSKLQGLLDG